MPITPSSNAVPVYTNPILGSGQSLMATMGRESSGWSFSTTLGAAAVSPSYANGYASLVVLANSGSSICKTIAQLLNPISTNYWWDDQGAAAGPNLSDAVTNIGLLTTAPVHIIWDIGQTDAGACGGAFAGSGLSAAAAQTLCINSLQSTWTALQTACNAGSPTNVKIGIILLQAGLDYGARAANSMAKVCFGATTIMDAPQIAAFTLANSTTVVITFTLDAAETSLSGYFGPLPTAPCGFRFEDSAIPGTPILANTWVWDDSTPTAPTLTATLAVPITGAIVGMFPYGSVPDFDYRQTIYGSDSLLPLGSFRR